ncbi:MAG: 2-succinyl-6-hydroxy-2,4-cyclohexadiene-1-carboxylate synthase [Chlamydiia bacterium]|nr:2-succinyl-6-hydroxy-2,4-cyclohexadiene-1-carboxylate synthase [Chlamydiia bacterium]
MIGFIHGFMGAPTDWDPILEALDYPSITLDLQTHSSYKAIKEFILQHPPLYLVGYSMGGRIATQLMHDLPDHILGAVLISSPICQASGTKEMRLAQEEEWRGCLKQEGVERFTDKWYQNPLFKTLQNNPGLLAKVQAKRKSLTPNCILSQLDEFSLAKQNIFWDTRITFSHPVLAIFGEKDKKYASMKCESPSVTRQVIPGVSHAVHLEAPTRVASEIKHFLEVNNERHNSPMGTPHPI